ncbi:MAG: type VI secretion system lipoprotein TssJ [Wenzhouxiangella sp.]|nr:type VI secretion system lipoprotein TssJ [Wenzhouxiangella sp.]
MTAFRVRWTVLILASALLFLSGCARDRTPPPTTVSVTLTAAADVNPDRNGRASPLMVRIYELRSAGVFENSDFFTLLEQDRAVLGSDQIARWEYQLEPGESMNLDATFQMGSGFVGVVAAYRDIAHARWRAIEPVEPNSVNEMEVIFDRLEVTVNNPR